MKFDANKDLEIDIKGRAAEFLFITDCLQEEEVLRHIQVNLGITSASDIEELPYFGKHGE